MLRVTEKMLRTGHGSASDTVAALADIVGMLVERFDEMEFCSTEAQEVAGLARRMYDIADLRDRKDETNDWSKTKA